MNTKEIKRKVPSSNLAVAIVLAFAALAAVEVTAVVTNVARQIYYGRASESGWLPLESIEADIQRVHSLNIWTRLILLAITVLAIVWFKAARKNLASLTAAGAYSPSGWGWLRRMSPMFHLMCPLYASRQAADEPPSPREKRARNFTVIAFMNVSWISLLLAANVILGFASKKVITVYNDAVRNIDCPAVIPSGAAKSLAASIGSWKMVALTGHMLLLACVATGALCVIAIKKRMDRVYEQMSASGIQVIFDSGLSPGPGGSAAVTPGFFMRFGGILLACFGALTLAGLIGVMVEGKSHSTMLSQVSAMIILGWLPAAGGVILFVHGRRKRKQNRQLAGMPGLFFTTPGAGPGNKIPDRNHPPDSHRPPSGKN